MKKKILIVILAMGLSAPVSISAQDDSYAKLAIGVEGGGAGFLFSALVSYRFLRPLALNVGLTSWKISLDSSSTGSTTISSSELKATIIPIYASFLLGTRHSLEILGGVDIISGTSNNTTSSGGSATFSGSGALPMAGVGYRFAPSTQGFFFRATVYGFYGTTNVDCSTDTNNNTTCNETKGVFAWVGLTVGYAFLGG